MLESPPLSDPQLSQIILTGFPTPLANAYQKLLQADTWQNRFNCAILLFDYGIRSLALIYVRQYLLQDSPDRLNDKELNSILSRFNQPSLGTWVDIMIKTLDAYKDHRDLHPFPELHAVINDEKQYKELKNACCKIVPIRNRVVHKFPPETEEEWEAIFGELIQHLEVILNTFKFIQNYKLIDITEIRSEGAIGVEYRGTRPCPIELPSNSGSLRADRLYFWSQTKQENRYYDLHPLMISWPPENESQDAAIYESLTNEKISYLATLMRSVVGVEEKTIIEQLTTALHKIRRRQWEVQRAQKDLSWDLWTQIASEITQIQTETIRAKYNPNVYLQRLTAKAMVDKFLASESTALLLMGKSGVGKSNFLLSLLEDYTNNQDVAVLMLDAARFRVGNRLETSLTDMIREVANLPDTLLEDLEKNLWGEINRIAGNRQFILIFDAVNENDRARELLAQIDGLIGGAKRPWLKVIISSRPQAWQIIQRGLHLAEHRYFRVIHSADVGIELEGFTMTEQGAELKDFTVDELPNVYNKYRDAWNLQTEYSDLPYDLKRQLRDPLTLKLISEIYENQQIPTYVDPSELYSHYINRLIGDHRLARQDVDFLEKDLIPLMLDANHFTNEITADQVAETTLSGGRPLRDLIHDSTHLDTYTRVNSSFTRLTDTEILVKQGGDFDFTIRFKYERFYDYFAGKRLSYLAKNDGLTSDNSYLRFIDQLKTAPYIWGAIQQALVQDVLSGNTSLLIELAKDDKQIVRDIIFNVILDLHKSDPDKSRLITLLMYQDVSLVIKKLAVQVSGAIGQSDILKQAGNSKLTELRVQAIQSTYYLWQFEPKLGWEVLTHWSNFVIGRLGIPNIKLLESIISLTMLIITDHRNTKSKDRIDFQNPAILKQLQVIWKGIINRLLFVNKEGNITNLTRIIWGRLTLSALIKFGLGVTTGASIITTRQRGSPIPLIKKYFRKSPKDRQIIDELIIEHRKESNGIYPLESLLHRALKDNEPLPLILALSLIMIRSDIYNPQKDIETINRLFTNLFDPKMPSMAAAQLVFMTAGILTRSAIQIEPQTWEIYTNIQRQYLDSGGLYYLPDQPKYEAGYIDGYTMVAARKLGDTFPSMFHEYFTRAVEGKPSPSIPGLLGEADSLAIVGKLPQSALVAMQPLLSYEDEETQDILCKVLARIRSYYPDLVDNYLWENNASPQLSMKVQTTVVTENLWADFLISRVGNFLSELLFMPEFREVYLSAFRYARTESSLEGWLIKTLQLVINFVYGSPII